MPQTIDHGSNASYTSSVRNLSAKWSLASSHHLTPSNVYVEDNLDRAPVTFWDPTHAVLNIQGTELTPNIEEYRTLIGRTVVGHGIVKPNLRTTRLALVSCLLGVHRPQLHAELAYSGGTKILTTKLLRFIESQAPNRIDATLASVVLQVVGGHGLEVALVATTIRSLDHVMQIAARRLRGSLVLLQIWLQSHANPFVLMRPVPFFNHSKSVISRLLPLMCMEECKVFEWIKIFPEIPPRGFKWRAAWMPPRPMAFRCPDFNRILVVSHAGSTTYLSTLVMRQLGGLQTVLEDTARTKFEHMWREDQTSVNRKNDIEQVIAAWRTVVVELPHFPSIPLKTSRISRPRRSTSSASTTGVHPQPKISMTLHDLMVVHHPGNLPSREWLFRSSSLASDLRGTTFNGKSLKRMCSWLTSASYRGSSPRPTQSYRDAIRNWHGRALPWRGLGRGPVEVLTHLRIDASTSRAHLRGQNLRGLHLFTARRAVAGGRVHLGHPPRTTGTRRPWVKNDAWVHTSPEIPAMPFFLILRQGRARLGGTPHEPRSKSDLEAPVIGITKHGRGRRLHKASVTSHIKDRGMPIRHSHQDHLGHHPPTMSTFERRTLGHPWLKLAPTPPWQATYNGASLVEVCTETTSNLIHLQLAFPKRPWGNVLPKLSLSSLSLHNSEWVIAVSTPFWPTDSRHKNARTEARVTTHDPTIGGERSDIGARTTKEKQGPPKGSEG
ncbi:hypothetical protein CRG98_029087 [Punica granatum]|uniref:Aminotransferase-like plant mobile domain-containing protein n=1 Tax=Punica granatum TaxID=22663 RepID=A0A2I0J3A4_PUNGR|nr:hypothetical protein CRG98_029087 [Punica granatum]